MWVYSQSSGQLWGPNFKKKTIGYSGYKSGKNNPDLEDVRNVGPIPRGLYVIGESYDSDKVGPLAIRLDPHLHSAHGRTSFLFHGDSISDPGNASRGCIIVSRVVRDCIDRSDERVLMVVE